MIELMENKDIYSTSKIDVPTKSDNDKILLHHLLIKLNIPINCFNNPQIRQHYLEEYSAKYSKAKHFLSNARKKQRKIILTYYEEKDKQIDMNQLQSIKDLLLEENEKIKKFKQALKDKLILYHQRIQFLKNTKFWSNFDSQHQINESIQTFISHINSLSISSRLNDSHHLLHEHQPIENADSILNNSYPIISDEHCIKSKLNEKYFSDIDDNVILFSKDSDDFIETSFNHRQSSYTELESEVSKFIIDIE